METGRAMPLLPEDQCAGVRGAYMKMFGITLPDCLDCHFVGPKGECQIRIDTTQGGLHMYTKDGLPASPLQCTAYMQDIGPQQAPPN